MDFNSRFEKLGIQVPDILLPKEDIDLTKWAVVACDQYTSEPEYWERVEKSVGNSPSTLHCIYPEVYLQASDKEKRIEKINSSMNRYQKEDLFRQVENSFIYVRRTLPNGSVRQGLLAALDLDQYSYEKGADSLIRATEGTILDRLPPRIQIRKNATIELPHIMVLIDDKENRLFSVLRNSRESVKQLYHTILMEEGGQAEGFQITGDKMLTAISGIFEELYNKARSRDGENPLLFAMGDGNHSFATAKAIWEKTKKETGNMNHPARWALVELVNIYDTGLEFEPIHRLAIGFDAAALMDYISVHSHIKLTKTDTFEEALQAVSGGKEHRIAVVSGTYTGILHFTVPAYNLAVASLDSLLDDCLPEKAEVDYIHGAETAKTLAGKGRKTAFILPDFEKGQLFPTVIQDGALPRKTFSMGEAREKRYYLEARKIIV